jgi:acetyl esterase/lipase
MTDARQSWQNRLLVSLLGFYSRRRPPMRSGWRGVRRTLERAADRLRPARDVRWWSLRAGGVPAEWVEAPGARADRAIVYLHGGGYVAGSPRSHRGLAGELGRAAGARVLSVDYRLAPEHPFPAAVDDAVAAVAWLLAQGYAPGRLAVAGDSAGGGLTIATLLSLRERGLPQPAAAACLSPWVDLEGAGETLRTHAHLDPMLAPDYIAAVGRHYVGEAGDLRHPLASPIHAELGGLAPLLVQVGAREVLLDDARRLVARVVAAGGRAELEVWAHMVHVWQIFGFLPEARRALVRLGRFLREHMQPGEYPGS